MRTLLNRIQNSKSGATLVEVLVAGFILILLAVLVSNLIGSSSRLFARSSIMMNDSGAVFRQIEGDGAENSKEETKITIVRESDNAVLGSFNADKYTYTNMSDTNNNKAEVQYSLIKTDNQGNPGNDENTGDEYVASTMLINCQNLLLDINAYCVGAPTKKSYANALKLLLQDYINDAQNEEDINAAQNIIDDIGNKVYNEDLIKTLNLLYYNGNIQSCTLSDEFVEEHYIYTGTSDTIYVKPLFYHNDDSTQFSAVITASNTKDTLDFSGVQMIYDPNPDENLGYDGVGMSAFDDGTGNWWRLPIDKNQIDYTNSIYPSIEQQFNDDSNIKRVYPRDRAVIEEVYEENLIGYAYDTSRNMSKIGSDFDSAGDVLTFIKTLGNAYYEISYDD